MNAGAVFFPCQKISFPAVKIDDFLTQAAEDIIKILVNIPTPTVPSLKYAYETKNVLLKLELIFNRTDGTNKKSHRS